MGSSDTTSPPPAATLQPVKHSTPPSQYRNNSHPVVLDVALRVLLFLTALIGIIVMVTSKQTKLIPVSPGIAVPLSAKLNYVPSFIYLVAALSVACLYSIISGVLSVLGIMKPKGSSTNLQFLFVMLDALLLGIMASATGAAIGVAYIGLIGNSHTGWNKICNTYDSFFRAAASILLSLVSSMALLLLVWLSMYVLYKKTTRR